MVTSGAREKARRCCLTGTGSNPHLKAIDFFGILPGCRGGAVVFWVLLFVPGALALVAHAEGRINHFPTHFAPVVPNPHSVQNADFPLEGIWSSPDARILSGARCALQTRRGSLSGPPE